MFSLSLPPPPPLHLQHSSERENTVIKTGRILLKDQTPDVMKKSKVP